jgi:hypothetical protein
MRRVKTLTNPVVDFLLLFVLVGVTLLVLHSAQASKDVFAMAILVICGLAGIAGGRLFDHWD